MWLFRIYQDLFVFIDLRRKYEPWHVFFLFMSSTVNLFLLSFLESCEETENLFSEDDYVPKIDDESDLVKSGETNTSDSDADNKHISNIQQQNSIQTWINNSNNGGEGNDKKKESNNADDEKKEPEKVSDKKTEQNKENS